MKLLSIVALSFFSFCQSSSILIKNSDNEGVCSTKILLFDIDKLSELEGCRSIQGNLAIVQMEDLDPQEFQKYSFPLLTEITGYLMLYRVSALKSLSQLFPNLSVIRGKTSFLGHSLILYKLLHLEEIGLNNLRLIENGGVKVEKNDLLCFADKVDWSAIVSSRSVFINKGNKPSKLCPSCPEGVENCWSIDKPQVKCDCGGNSCDQNGKCCAESCLTCNISENMNSCQVCRNFKVFSNKSCVDSCPLGTFKFGSLCLTSLKCKSMNKGDKPPRYLPFQGECTSSCPQGYDRVEIDFKTEACVNWNDTMKRCKTKTVDSVESAEMLKGCKVIEGPLEIQIMSVNFQDKKSAQKIQSALSDIEIIEGYLKVARSPSFTSLRFLKNLKEVQGNRLESGKYSIVVWDNKNLREIFKTNQKVKIKRGKFFFHYNPKLCFDKVEEFAGNSSLINNFEFAKESNGDKTNCGLIKFQANVTEVLSFASLIEWKAANVSAGESILGFTVHYTEDPDQDVEVWYEKDPCSVNGWIVEDVDNLYGSDSLYAYPLTNLKPNTQYAFYVTQSDYRSSKLNIESEIQYFTTLPGELTSSQSLETVSAEIEQTKSGEFVKCRPSLIDTIEKVRMLKGCQVIEGPLEIEIRKRSNRDVFIAKELESALSDIVEIQDYLKVVRSTPVYSLRFLKNLKVIRGNKLDNDKYIIKIWDNQNLQELFQKDQTVEIGSGKVFFHHNPQLCLRKILNFAPESSIDHYEFASMTNGDKGCCTNATIHPSVVRNFAHAVLLNWKPLKLEDDRMLLSYEIFYKKVEDRNVNIFESRDICSDNGWMLDDVSDFNSNDVYIAYPITRLEPFSLYAYYVRAVTLSEGLKYVTSDIQYFMTMPGQPSPVRNLMVKAESDSELSASWNHPLKINGEFDHFIVTLKKIAFEPANVSKIIDVCSFCEYKLENIA